MHSLGIYVYKLYNIQRFVDRHRHAPVSTLNSSSSFIRCEVKMQFYCGRNFNSFYSFYFFFSISFSTKHVPWVQCSILMHQRHHSHLTMTSSSISHWYMQVIMLKCHAVLHVKVLQALHHSKMELQMVQHGIL